MESIVEDISTLEVIVPSTSTTPSHLPVLLLCHGYGAGKAFYAASLQELSRHYRVLLIDWLGFGRSNRTGAFPPQNVEQTHEFFSESIERWRKAMDIDRFYLLGHSMGGYLSAVYALKYPEHVTHLYLASPVGLPEKPTSVWTRSWFVRTLGLLWDNDVTPLVLVRWLGPLSKPLTRRICRFRFGDFMTEEQVEAFGEYVYHLNAGPSSSDGAITRLLAVGAWSRQPLGRSLHNLQMPVTFMYGEADWMSYEAAIPIVDSLRARHCRRAGGADSSDKLSVATIYIIPDAGHQVFIMNSSAFTRVILHHGQSGQGNEFHSLVDDRVFSA